MIGDLLMQRKAIKKFRKSADDVINKMAQQSDKNGDGKISKQEFLDYCKTL